MEFRKQNVKIIVNNNEILLSSGYFLLCRLALPMWPTSVDIVEIIYGTSRNSHKDRTGTIKLGLGSRSASAIYPEHPGVDDYLYLFSYSLCVQYLFLDNWLKIRPCLGQLKEQPSHALICYEGDDPTGILGSNRFAIQSRDHGVLYIDESCGEGEDNPAEHLEWQFHQDCIK